MSDQERCPKCNGLVYAEHYKNEWMIHCCHCDLKTKKYSTHDLARRDWDRLVESIREKPRAERSE